MMTVTCDVCEDTVPIGAWRKNPGITIKIPANQHPDGVSGTYTFCSWACVGALARVLSGDRDEDAEDTDDTEETETEEEFDQAFEEAEPVQIGPRLRRVNYAPEEPKPRQFTIPGLKVDNRPVG